MLISAVRHFSCLIAGVLATLAITGTTATAQPSPADLVGILRAIVAIRDGQGKLTGDTAVWHLTAGDVAAIELARAGSIPYRVVKSSGQARCAREYDVTVEVQSSGPNAARVSVGLRCLNAPGSRLRTYYFGRYYEVVRAHDKWIARFEGLEITMSDRPLPNFAVEQTAGSHTLAAAAHRER